MQTTNIAKIFGCTDEQLRAQYQKNAMQLGQMAEKADRTGKKVNGYTADELREMHCKKIAIDVFSKTRNINPAE